MKNGIMLILATSLSIAIYAQQPPSKNKEKSNVVKSSEGELVSEVSSEPDAGAQKKIIKKKTGEPKSMKNKEAEMASEMEKIEVPAKGAITDNEITSNEVIVESAGDIKVNNISSDNKIVDDIILKANDGQKLTKSKAERGIQKGKSAKIKTSSLKSSKKLKLKKGIVKKVKVTSETTKKKGSNK